MSKELVIGSNRHETKVAILEEDQLVEVYFQRANEYSLAGSIHKGRVTRVLPGMQSAFVDLGLERDTFLYVSDFFEENEDIDTVGDEKPERRERESDRDRNSQARMERSAATPIELPVANREFVAALPDDPDEVGDEPLFEAAASPMANAEAAQMAGPQLARINGRPDSQMEEDRGGMRGDRRARRSRRRRPRSSGIPETKYAQPGRESSAAPLIGQNEPSRSHETSRGEVSYPESLVLPVTAARGPEADDVIMLPGESLAKYRRVVLPSETASAEPKLFLPDATVYHVETDEQVRRNQQAGLDEHTGAEEQEFEGDIVTEGTPAIEDADEEDEGLDESQPIPLSLEEEAREIELTDRILSHAPESLYEKEEKLAEVRQDQPVSPFIVSDIETDAEPEEAATGLQPEALREQEHVRFVVPGDTETEEAIERSHEEAAFESAHLHASYVGPEGLETATLEPSDSPMARSYEGAGEYSIAPSDPTAFEDSDEPFEHGNEAEAGDAGEVATSEIAPGQTATVRADDGRSMHRSSRRMRRRRGGNRSNPQGGLLSGNVSGESILTSPATLVTSSIAGAAAAQQPEGRAEPVRRDFTRESNRESGRETNREASRETARTAVEDRSERALPSISELLKPGQEIIVQIAKEPLGQKGARITSHVALPGRYVVFMPSVTHLGVSRKIASDEERQRLKRILQAHKEGTTGGFIVRTAGEGVPEDEIAADMDFLYKLWLDIRQKAEKKPAPLLLHYDLDVVQRILRDQVTEEFKAIWVDNEELYENVVSFMQRFQPGLVNRVKMYTRAAPIFDAFGITQELEKALRPKVWLKSGGYIVINQTEALVAIDINTGKYVGKSNRLEDTIVKTNTEAVKEIVRQIRLRDLGGIIVVDFIDMDERKNRQKVMQTLEEAMQSDKAPYKILQFNDFGLVAITRKRVKQSLERTLCAPCPYCEGAGYVKSVQTTIGEIIVEAQKIAKAIEGKDVLLRVHPEVAKVLKANDNKYLEEIEEMLGRPVMVKGDPALHTEKFDLG